MTLKSTILISDIYAPKNGFNSLDGSPVSKFILIKCSENTPLGSHSHFLSALELTPFSEVPLLFSASAALLQAIYPKTLATTSLIRCFGPLPLVCEIPELPLSHLVGRWRTAG